MTLDQCYQQNQGQALLVTGGGDGNNGQCVQWADTVLYEVYGLQTHFANAIDWWRNPGELLANFDQIADVSVKKGDFVIYGAGVGSQYGHIDVAAQDGSFSSYIGYDSNWGGSRYYNSQGYPVLHEVVHNDSYNKYILGVLRLKGGTPPQEDIVKPNAQQITVLFEQFALREPTADQLSFYAARDLRDLYQDLLTYEVKPNQAEVELAFKQYMAVPINTPPNTDQTTYYTQRPKGALYSDIAADLKTRLDAETSGVSKKTILDYLNNNLN